MPEIKESDIKISNWLNMATFAVARYASMGGAVEILAEDDALLIRLPNIDIEQVNKNFMKLLEVANEAV